jgi:asparagine synthase (glutamine-hydrolysing)
MCGITGIFNPGGQPLGDKIISSMTDALAHRGPDGRGIFVEETIALGHRRLAILDTSNKGAQPMSSHDNRWVVVFNGCIYNFRELKIELQSLGHYFNSTTDTEIITEALSAYGPDVFKRFDGMFAIAAWDREKKELWLSRDRYGIKPLYYTYVNNKFLFASEIKAFLKHPDFKVEVDSNALNEYFTFQNLFSFRTLFKNVALIPPANTIRLNSASAKIYHSSWWDYDFSSPDEGLGFEESVTETKRLFENAVTRQMVADVPVGSYLSGGMDSGSVAAIAGAQVPRLYTFTCGFDMSEVTGVEANYDERRDAELMANHFKTEHYEQVINAGDIKWSLPKVIWHLEDLKVGMSYPNYYISRLASKFVKVCLQGTGGDELFGGYPWRYYRVFNSISRDDFFEQYYQFWQRLVPDGQRKKLFQPATSSQIDFSEPRTIFEKVFLFNDKLKYDSPENHIQNSLYFEIKTFLPGLLMVGDKLSMANGLEERFPFLDNALVDFAQRVPVRHKLANLEAMKRIDENEPNKRKMYQSFNDGKNVLRQAMQGFIPEKIINREKQGFSAPDESWYRGENADYVKELLLNKRTVSSEFIDPAYMKQIIDEHINQHINHRLLIWSFMSFEWWCRIFLNGEKVD